ncbi:MAG: rRNA maturation RNase YbeY [Sphingomonadales bacterium]
MDVDVLVEAEGWRGIVTRAAVESLCADAVERAAAATELHDVAVSVTVLLTDDAAVRDLNARYRGQDSATNVLSFPFLDGDELGSIKAGEEAHPGELAHLGDVAVALETVVREAQAAGKPVDQHLTHLVIHGFLHLVGYDHLTDDDATVMENLERRVLADFQIPDPYSS